MTETLTEAKEGRLACYSAELRPPGSYTATMAIFKCGSLGASLIAAQRSRRLPKRIGAGDIVLLGVATHKLSRLIATDTATSPLRAPFTRYEGSGTKLEYVRQDRERYTPHVIEPAGGPDRTLLAMLVDAYDEEVVAHRQRTVLRLHPQIAPVKAAVLPLIAKDDAMVSTARALYEELREEFMVEYDDAGAIGRRYRRQDEIGTPFAFTIDEETAQDQTVTIRDRDSLEQERVGLTQVRGYLGEALQRPWKRPKPD